MKEFNNLEVAYKVLTVLKSYKSITRTELVIKSNVNQSYVTNSIMLLRRKGFKIDTLFGESGGYEYRGYKRAISKNEKLKQGDSKSIANLYKAGVSIQELKELTGKTKESIFYNLKKEKVILNRKVKKDKELLKRLYEEGHSLKKIAEITNTKYSLIQKNIYRYVKSNRR